MTTQYLRNYRNVWCHTRIPSHNRATQSPLEKFICFAMADQETTLSKGQTLRQSTRWRAAKLERLITAPRVVRDGAVRISKSMQRVPEVPQVFVLIFAPGAPLLVATGTTPCSSLPAVGTLYGCPTFGHVGPSALASSSPALLEQSAARHLATCGPAG
jgi:hypothetical protein